MSVLKQLHWADAFTALNALLGFLAITYTLDGNLTVAAVLILVAVIADGLDGIVARRFNDERPSMGNELDIMADYVSFCVAPAVMLYASAYQPVSPWWETPIQSVLVALGAGSMVVLGLIRLARHAKTHDRNSMEFAGIPSTAAGLILVLALLSQSPPWASGLIAAALGLLMVGEFKVRKIAGGGAFAASMLILLVITINSISDAHGLEIAVSRMALSVTSFYLAIDAITMNRRKPSDRIA